MNIIPYLTFHGNCEDALQTYINAFGGEILYLSRWSENTASAAELVNRVMHVEFVLGDTRMAAGDSLDEMDTNTSIKLMVHLDTMDAAQSAVKMLAEGGSVLSPLKPHPAPDDSGCGSVTRDRFGYTWIVTCPNPKKHL